MTDDGTYILVSHADPITGCLMLLGNLKRKEISFPRGGIIKITKTGNGWKIGQLNQI
jgi:phosphohistidine phosphatase SixA